MRLSHTHTHPSFFMGCQPCEVVMVNSLGCDKHNRTQGARVRQEGTTQSPPTRGVWTVPMGLSPPTRTDGIGGC